MDESITPIRHRSEGASSDDGSNTEDEEQWAGISEPEELDRDAEYVDEGRFTTVTVEAMDVSRSGLQDAAEKMQDESDLSGENTQNSRRRDQLEPRKLSHERRRPQRSKKGPIERRKKKKFHYEGRTARKVTRAIESSKNRRQAKARRAA